MTDTHFGTIKAAFFDLDDTLCDDAAAWVSCARMAAHLGAERNGEIDPEKLARVFLGISERYWISLEPVRETRAVFDVRLAQWLEALESCGYEPSRELAGLLAREYGRRRITEIALFPDVAPTLKTLRDGGVQLVLITNGLRTTHIEKIAHLGLEALFDHVVIAGVLGRFKPDARIFEHALELCGVEAGEAVMIGDDPVNDIGGAEDAGIRSFWYNPKSKDFPADMRRPSGGEIRTVGEILTALPIAKAGA